MIRVAVAGAGAIGSAVCRALIDGIEGFTLTAASSLDPEASRKLIGRSGLNLPFLNLPDLAAHADWVVEALPAAEVPDLTRQLMTAGKTMVMITSSALLLHPGLKDLAGKNDGRIIIPSGALAGMDGINALAEGGIKSARLKTTKPPRAYAGAPHIENEKIDLRTIESPTTIFSGNAKEAAAAFPANINVAATLCLATRLPPESVQVEIFAEPGATANRHEVTVEGEFSALRFSVENKPDPANPKSSALAGMSIVSLLRRQAGFFTVG